MHIYISCLMFVLNRGSSAYLRCVEDEEKRIRHAC